MRPTMQKYILKNIKNLTHDVYELICKGENEINVIPGQFITFMIDEIGARAYSILEKNGKDLTFIIKKLELENGGRGGSKYLCELKKGSELKGIGASGHFILKENEKNKLFLGTGTGLVPLYYQIKSGLEAGRKEKMKFIFGVRKEVDIFYLEELNKLKEKYLNFDFEIYLSNEENPKYKKGYIIQELENIGNFEEVYLCGNPMMIDSAKEILEKNNFPKENIFDEKY